jgi:hypothetical protein
MTQSEKGSEEPVEFATEVAYVEALERQGGDGPAAIVTALDGVGNKPDPWGRGHIQLYMLCVVVYLCSTMNGMSSNKTSAARIVTLDRY